jgi:threonine dehydrogenase-like Zn-dependent dehydrogenase
MWQHAVMFVGVERDQSTDGGDVRRAHVPVETVPDARLVEPTDALVRVTRACICGSDL